MPQPFLLLLLPLLSACEDLSKLADGSVVVIIEDDSEDQDGEIDTGSSTDTGHTSTWPPDAPLSIYLYNVTGSTTRFHDFMMFASVYHDGDLIMSDPTFLTSTGTQGAVCSWPLSLLTTGSPPVVGSSGNWCVFADANSKQLGDRLQVNGDWVVISDPYIDSVSSSQSGAVYIFQATTLQGLSGATTLVSTADFILEGTRTFSDLRAVYLDGDILYVSDQRSGVNEEEVYNHAQLFTVDLSTLTSSDPLTPPDVGTVLVDDGLQGIGTYADMASCENTVTGQRTHALLSEGYESVHLYTQNTPSDPWVHVEDYTDTSGRSPSFPNSMHCWEDTDGDGFLDILAGHITEDSSFILPSAGASVPLLGLDRLLHWSWQQPTPVSWLNFVGEHHAIVPDYQGAAWLLSSALQFTTPAGTDAPSVFLSSYDDIVEVPSTHPLPGQKAAVPSYVVHLPEPWHTKADFMRVANETILFSTQTQGTVITNMADLVAAAE